MKDCYYPENGCVHGHVTSLNSARYGRCYYRPLIGSDMWPTEQRHVW